MEAYAVSISGCPAFQLFKELTDLQEIWCVRYEFRTIGKKNMGGGVTNL